ncbi:sulfotransferase domain-containing protein [Aureococcus anophagefferens]|nr:sulfotransferase domain-containing protein [Aureococcus anophagefferens]
MRVLALLACGAAATPDWPAVRARGANASFSFPAFYVGGAAKCGTTTLSAWFAQHPRVLAPRVKEPFFFGKTETAQRRDMPDYFPRPPPRVVVERLVARDLRRHGVLPRRQGPAHAL